MNKRTEHFARLAILSGSISFCATLAMINCHVKWWIIVVSLLLFSFLFGVIFPSPPPREHKAKDGIRSFKSKVKYFKSWAKFRFPLWGSPNITKDDQDYANSQIDKVVKIELPIELGRNPQLGLTDAKKLTEIRRICLDLDTMITQNPNDFMVSGQWFTGYIMCVAKFGDGYPDCDAPENHVQTRFKQNHNPK